ncbi:MULTISPECIES: Cu(I)-responsive transcriptional regulator [Photobacterium]|uniref:HTH-type transcriptional regulator CueR n=1 Tax=Photobacterium ganghwense TaxID=320778 RepID=A0A0J1H0J2_9GAMM|nr:MULTISPECIES: Cu(I)-responsive transcriptional regulator [Photobacterium]KLV05345.1 transcriptional regulator [Photobacterium ganghwense]MBV1841659.1 Cu(I)-responsive transcriptional regulator [Photobacterium ganghwense]PSU05738.1 Cu(I)-responsive transcriptional regulator [Photobacterium ganghwense]QSV15546.1 Cu(I)-responsive transcriptional regulator [Photobacterium ganghwense]
MNISEVAQRTGLTTKTIRFYEDKGVISPPLRAENGYRQYSRRHLDELLLIRRSRLVGFTLEESRELLEFSRDPHRRSADVKAKAEQKLLEIDGKIRELLEMKQTLEALTKQCPGDEGARCPIIDGLSRCDG